MFARAVELDPHFATAFAWLAASHLLDHVNQRSIYFSDPEGNRLEIYYEKPNWAEIFENGRGDDDGAFSFDDPAPGWE